MKSTKNRNIFFRFVDVHYVENINWLHFFTVMMNQDLYSLLIHFGRHIQHPFRVVKIGCNRSVQL